MSIRNLSFRDLEYVISVAECGSVSRAADACAITQPALSERLQRIEASLGIELFERSKRAMFLTPAGEKLVIKARHLLDDTKELDKIISSSQKPLSGPLHIGVIATLGPFLMPHVLPLLRKQYPESELVLEEGLTNGLLSRLQAGKLDVVIAAAPLHAVGITTVELFHEPFILAIPKEHELANRKTINASDLCGEDMVLLEDGHCLSGQALDVCPVKQRLNRKRLHALTLETLRHMVATGAGYTLLPSLAVGRKPKLSKLILYRILDGDDQYGRTIVLCWRKSYGRETDIEHLITVIKKSLPKSYGVKTKADSYN